VRSNRPNCGRVARGAGRASQGEAFVSASTASWAVIRSFLEQPTMRFEQMSFTALR
jgi:hypothetical protein